MVGPIHLHAVKPVQEKEIIQQSPYISPAQKYVDTIRFGKDETNVFVRGYRRAKDFFYWIYVKIRVFLSNIFPCVDCLKMEETPLERYQKVYRQLDSCHASFQEKKKRVELKELKQWWKKTFNSFDSDVQKWLLMEDTKTYDSESDTKNSDEENYERHKDFAMIFVVELQPYKAYDPLEYVPGYLESVKEHIQEKINKAPNNL